jgi:hypothetical protein
MYAILLRLLIALLTFLINIGIVKMATLAIRQIPKVLRTEQKQSQKPELGPVSLLPGSRKIGAASSASFSLVNVRTDGTLVISENQSASPNVSPSVPTASLPG